MGIEIAEKVKKQNASMLNTERSLLRTQINIYTEAFSVPICPLYMEKLLFFPDFISIFCVQIEISVFNMLACLTPVSLLFSAISIPMF